MIRWVKRHAPAPSINYLIVGALIASMLLISLAAMNLWVSVTANQSVDAQRRSDEVTTCRSAWRTPIDRADAALEEARNARDDAYLVGLAAVVREDDDVLLGLLDEVPVVREEVAAAIEAKRQASRSYELAVQQSLRDPASFLESCRTDPPPG